MSWVDVTILTALVVSVLLGLYWGLIRQVASTLGLIAAIWLAGQHYQDLAAVLHPPEGGGLIADPNMANIVAFALIAIGVSLAVGVVAGILRTVLNLIFLGWLDHLLGAVLGGVQMLLLIEILLVVATVFPVPDLSDAVRQSTLAGIMLQPLYNVVWGLLPPEIHVLWPYLSGR